MVCREGWALLHWFLPCSAALSLLLLFQKRWTLVVMIMMMVVMKMMMKYDQVDVEVEDRGLIALSIIIGKLQVFYKQMIEIVTKARKCNER